MKPLRSLVSLYDKRILGIFLPSKADAGICGAIDQSPVCVSD